MAKWNEMRYDEQKRFCSLLENWLRPYTEEVILSMTARRDEILDNPFAVKMLEELMEREEKEEKELASNIYHLLDNYDNYKAFNPRNYYTTHSKAYREVLFDLFIRNRKEEKKDE